MAADIDWNLCLFCQEPTVRGDNLKCPRSALGTARQKLEPYERIHENLHKLWQAGLSPDVKLPKHITAQSMHDNFGKVHKSYKLKYSASKVEEMLVALRNKTPEPQESAAPKRSRTSFNNSLCIYCQQEKNEVLHNVETMSYGTDYKAIAEKMQDRVMMVRFGDGDLVASEAKYHLRCAVDYRNKYRKFLFSTTKQNTYDAQLNSQRAFYELIDSIKVDASNGVKFFPLAELHKTLNERRKQLGLEPLQRPTTVKEKVLTAFHGDLQEQGTDRGPKTLVFGDGVRTLLKDAMEERKSEEDIKLLVRAAKIIREDIFNHKGFQFDGSFEENCQADSLPASLKTLVNFIISGTSLKDQQTEDNQPCLTAGQILFFKAKE